MKISYNWLKDFLKTDLEATEAGRLLTDCGLEVESIEAYETVKGGLQGMVIGEVKTKEKHPDADRLSLTTVDIGNGAPLHIVCGAANVAVGQKVVVATIGATLYPSEGEPFQIKKSKIRGALSEGMICAEDEIGLGASHEGIMVLAPEAIVGSAASEYFKIETDNIFEIGLTPNRADAASHLGVARDLAAVLTCRKELNHAPVEIQLPDMRSFKSDNTKLTIDVVVEEPELCPRYCGLTITGIEVKPSPEWLKQRLQSIGLKSINNVVDATNYVMHELGQPLHAFDANKISGRKIIVKKLPAKTKFQTLDGVTIELNGEELMICNTEEAMCLAGVYGGMGSGVSDTTKNIFIESACFHPVPVRRASKAHGLKTDAAFRFERGVDPHITVYALQRAALLIKEIAGGKISSDITDKYPTPIEPYKVAFSYKNCDTLSGKEIDRTVIKSILTSLGIEITSEGADALLLAVPPFKVDVERQADVIEEVLRIYGYNNIELPQVFRSSLSFSSKPDKNKLQNTVSDALCSWGFTEIMNTTLTKENYYESLEQYPVDKSIHLINPLSSDLNVLRQTLIFSGLETLVYNMNRQTSDLKMFEFGKTYKLNSENNNWKYEETSRLSLFMTGRKAEESWNTSGDPVNLFSLKGAVSAIFARFGLNSFVAIECENDLIHEGLQYEINRKPVAIFGKVKKSILKKLDIKQPVYYADIHWDLLTELAGRTKILFKDVPKFPEVRRDLALLIDQAVKFEQLEQLAYQTERKLLKSVNLFDVYEGDKLESGKKSYALSFILQDESATLTDVQIERIMEKLQKTFEEKVGAKIR